MILAIKRYTNAPFTLRDDVSRHRATHSADLLAELIERGRALGHHFVGVLLDLLGGEDVVVEEELAHELVPVVSPQVGVGVERRAVLSRAVHHQSYVLHQLRPHLRQLLHVLQVRLPNNIISSSQ